MAKILSQRLSYYFSLLFCIAIIPFCCFYLASTHDGLAHWFTSLNSCFYHNQTWATDFFTPGIKSDGNMYCIIAMLVAATGIFYCVRRIRGSIHPTGDIAIYRVNAADAMFALTGIIIGAALWAWGARAAMPAYDEVFSAENAAGIHPFQCIAYYMLPNNHLFFNLLNGTIFHFAADKVITGRIISLFTYCAFIVALFFWLNHLFRNRWLALLMSVTASLQFMVWGFSFQARGYELCLLAEWGLFISLFMYLGAPQKKWLRLNTMCIAAGYFCMPSFLYFYAAQIIFILFYMLFYKRPCAALWKYQLIGVLLAYLCYLPALCFSGLEAITHNNWVAPMQYKTVSTFSNWFFPYFEANYIDHIFSNIEWKSHSLNIVLYFAPVLLLFDRKNKTSVMLGMFYLDMWLVFLAIVLLMNRPPFERNLIGHYSITLAALLLLLYRCLSLLSTNRLKAGQWILFPLAVIGFAAHFICTNPDNLKNLLYEYDVNRSYTEISTGLSRIPKGSTVCATDEGFYCLYICTRNGYGTSKCGAGTCDYMVKQPSEPMPSFLADKYFSVSKGNEYEICKRK